MNGKKAKQIRKLVEQITKFKISESPEARRIYRKAKAKVS